MVSCVSRGRRRDRGLSHSARAGEQHDPHLRLHVLPELGESGVDDGLLGLATQHPEHRDAQIDGQTVGDPGAGAGGGEPVAASIDRITVDSSRVQDSSPVPSAAKFQV